MVQKKAPRAKAMELRPRAFEKLKALGREKMLSIQTCLRGGDSTSKVAHMIQLEWGDFEGVPKSTLERMLQRYRQKVLIDPAVLLIASVDDEGAKEIVERNKKPFNVLYEMEELFGKQKERFQRFLEQEEKLKIPNSQTRYEVELLLKQLESIKKTQFDLGIVAFKGPMPAGTISVHTDKEGNTHVDMSLGQAVQEAMKVIEGSYTTVEESNDT